MNKDMLIHLAILAMLSLAPVVYAQPSDPITIEADQAILQEKQGLSIYRGNVVLKQGELKFAAEEITVHSTNGKLSRMVAIGEPVRFDQKKIDDREPINAKAESVEYLAVKQKVLLKGNATLAQGNNQFTGNLIQYDINSDTVTAGSAGKTAAKGKQQRVKVTIQPDRGTSVTGSKQ